MQPKFMVQFVLGALIFTGGFALKAEAGYHQPRPSQQAAFSCDISSPTPKIVSNRTRRTLFTWGDRHNGQQPCAAATNRLNSQVRRNGNTTKGLVFNAGVVNNQTVVCVGTVTQFGCNAGNTVVNISQGNQSSITNAGDVMAQLQPQIQDIASGRPVVQTKATDCVDASEF
ncbi:COP23 domain-containing protein [Kamptonema formosum]|uniref:COP23 domain-containing protein n=1 Tax=Kamptonema formosum TaxID=331992 RepID=UPI00034BE584|nr:COP23 domain-containing protein [Oscillatoria sp. PCC 10802]